MKPSLTPAAFDRLLTPPSKPEKLWGAPAIAQAIGLSAESVPTLAARNDVPIYKPGGRYFAFRSELMAWLRTKPRS